MKAVVTVTILLLFVKFGFLQQCRQLTVCDDDVSGARGAMKGDVGAPGKAGAKGAKGEVGLRGMEGEACDLESFKSEVREELREIRASLTPTSCLTSLKYGRQILSDGQEAFCDAGWTVVQRRFDGSLNFDRTWAESKNGFGDLSSEFWLGLDKIHNLTKNRGCKLRIDIWDFEDDHAFALYTSFSIEDESDNYRLHIGGYSGTAGDSMVETEGQSWNYNNMQFTTKDRDNDDYSSGNCAITHGGPWWHNHCGTGQLNSRWGRSTNSWQYAAWYTWKGNQNSLKATTMKIRCD